MKIAVCIKRVPDTEARVKVAGDGVSIDEAGVKFILNPYDEYALEEALQRKEQAGAGEVVVVTLGPEAAQETIRTALAMGADRGVLLKCDAIPADGLAVAKALAGELKDGGYDLVLFGKLAVDDANHAVGPMVAELLGLPCVTAVVKLELEGGTGRAERERNESPEGSDPSARSRSWTPYSGNSSSTNPTLSWVVGNPCHGSPRDTASAIIRACQVLPVPGLP